MYCKSTVCDAMNKVDWEASDIFLREDESYKRLEKNRMKFLFDGMSDCKSVDLYENFQVS